jgi:hypothetical protein
VIDPAFLPAIERPPRPDVPRLDPTASWWLKLDRAEKHLCELEDLVLPCLQRDVYPTVKRWETYNHQRTYVYRLDLPELPNGISIVIGDVMFNVRSALDHLAVAFATDNRKLKAQWPIFTCDVHAIDELTGDYLHKRDFKAWRKAVSGLPRDAVDYLESIQPWHFKEQGHDPRDHVMALLAQFQNADKHRQLVLTGYGVKDPVFWFDPGNGLLLRGDPRDIGEGLAVDRALPNRAIVHMETTNPPPKMDLYIEGTPSVLVGVREVGPYRILPQVIGAFLIRAMEWVAKLEPMLPS